MRKLKEIPRWTNLQKDKNSRIPGGRKKFIQELKQANTVAQLKNIVVKLAALIVGEK